MKNLWMRIVAVAAAVTMAFALTGCFPEKRSGAENYDKSYYTDKYGGDLDSNLAVFPDEVEEGRISMFQSSMGEGLFDTDGYIILGIR